ncbi:MAG: DUF642 domain-containing protein [Ideonella sp.]|nr:DUF642 domain-containing protein [Ideonella sp.]MCC7456517.1 DUF642 domain-containing protein [Nitrospira sp.]
MRHTSLVASALLCSAPAFAADRAITPPPAVSMSWGYVTHNNAVEGHRQPAVGFWQRASGAKPGVGIVFVGTMEYQLPETPPSHVRSATFQFSGKQSQCVGAEPVVIEVYAYAADGRGDKADAQAGTRMAQMRADCTTNPAFTQPIDVTALVRQLSVPSGIRHIGFNMRKANNRQGPGLFSLSPGKLTIVVADEALAQQPAPRVEAPSGATVLSESFEAPASGNYTVVRAGQAFSTSSSTWAVEAGSIDIVNTRVRTEAAAFDGIQGIDLAGSPGAGVISTRLATQPGQQYRLTFHYARNNGIGATPARARVEMIGAAPLLQSEVQHDSRRLPFNAYQRYSALFQADGTSATLRFSSLNDGNFGVVLDAVSVVAVPSGMSAGAPLAGAPGAAQPTAAGPNGLIKALGTLVRGGGSKAARDQAKGEALDGIATLPAAGEAPAAPAAPQQNPQ